MAGFHGQLPIVTLPSGKGVVSKGLCLPTVGRRWMKTLDDRTTEGKLSAVGGRGEDPASLEFLRELWVAKASQKYMKKRRLGARMAQALG